jgi:hypothetical protein
LIPLLLAILAFGLTLAIENWPARKAASTPTTTPAKTRSGDVPAPTTSFVGIGSDKVAQHIEPAATQDSSDSGNAMDGDGSDTGPPPPEEERAPALIRLEQTDSGQIATFQSLGSKRMTFTISTHDSTGAVHSSIQVTAPPHKSEVLNDQGLIIMPGDQILVQSPPYQEFSVSAY